MSRIIMRKARHDFEAYLTAEAMEKAGATVISIAYDGQHQLDGAMIPTSKFVVFARVPGDVDIDTVDGFIDHELFPDECSPPTTNDREGSG